MNRGRSKTAGLTEITALCAALGLAAALGGCVEKAQHLSKADKEQRSKIVTRERPQPGKPLDVQFGSKVKLLGYDLADPRVVPGRSFQITWYWQVDQPLGAGWKVFTHLADAKGKSRVNMDANRRVRDLHPEADWQAGEYIKDMQEITLPEDWGSDAVTFYMGFWKDQERLAVAKGEHDDEKRARVLTLPVIDGLPKATLPKLRAKRTAQPVQLDGKLDEPAWATTGATGPLVNTLTGGEGSFVASARVLHDASNLYIAFEVKDELLKCRFAARDDHLWEEDAVEVMLDPDGDGKNYFELQVSPTGLVFDTRYDSRRKPQPFGHVDWHTELSAKTALDGTPNDADEDRGYVVEMAIPWTAFAVGEPPASPPAADAVWRINFYVMDARDKGQRAVGWSPPRVGDFHVPDRFGEVQFVE
jgi:hypothetical protein